MFYSTRGISPALRQSAWQDVLNVHCARFVTKPKTINFEASLETCELGGFLCSRIIQTPGTAYRSVPEIEAAPAPQFVLLMQMTGSSTIIQNDRSIRVSPGGITLLDLEAPVTMHFDCRSVQLALHVPKDELQVPEDRCQRLIARTLPAALGSLIGSFARVCFDEIIPAGEPADTVSSAILTLLRLALSADENENQSECHRISQQLRVIQDYASNHLQEDLSPAALARANNVSERTLHRMFEARGMSVSHWIRDRRLEQCAADLRDAAMMHRTVTDILFQWGFNSASHFSRVFRAQFGCSPRDYRARETKHMTIERRRSHRALTEPGSRPAPLDEVAGEWRQQIVA